MVFLDRGGPPSIGGGISWFAQSVQLNVSPTYADPNDGGRFKIGLRMNGSGFVNVDERGLASLGSARMSASSVSSAFLFLLMGLYARDAGMGGGWWWVVSVEDDEKGG